MPKKLTLENHLDLSKQLRRKYLSGSGKKTRWQALYLDCESC